MNQEGRLASSSRAAFILGSLKTIIAIHHRDSMEAEIQGLVAIFGSENDSPSR
jgi:hypothetical protein